MNFFTLTLRKCWWCSSMLYVLISNQLQYDLNYDFNLDLLSCEDIWINVFKKNNSKKYLIGVIHRHPNNSKSDFITTLVIFCKKLTVQI